MLLTLQNSEASKTDSPQSRLKAIVSVFLKPLNMAWTDFKTGIEVMITRQPQQPFLRIWFTMLCGVLVCWFLYVPIHELLHVAGCLITGGEVHELRLSALYGADILKQFFPFIVSGSEYAGRLTGFSTHDSDFTYFVTVFMPFTLTVLFGGMLLQLAVKRKNAFLFGVSLVIAGAPFIALTGDYLEMGGILVTRFIKEASFWSSTLDIRELYRFRSDDLFRLFEEQLKVPSDFGINRPIDWLRTILITGFSQTLGLFLAGWTYFLSSLTGRLIK